MNEVEGRIHQQWSGRKGTINELEGRGRIKWKGKWLREKLGWEVMKGKWQPK